MTGHRLDAAPVVDGAPTTRGGRHEAAILLVQLGIVVSAIAMAWAYTAGGLQTRAGFFPVSAMLVGTFVWSVWSWKRVTGRLFDPYVLFITAAYLQNAGLIIFDLLGASRYGARAVRLGATIDTTFSEQTVVKALLLVLVCLSALHGAALVTATRRKFVNKKVTLQDSGQRRRDVRVVGWALILISIVPSLILYRQLISTRGSEGYVALYIQPTGDIISKLPSVLAAFLIPGAIFLLAGSKSRLDRIVALSCLSGVALIYFVVGVRSISIMVIAAGAWVWHVLIRRIPRSVILGGAAVVFLIIAPVVSVMRENPGLGQETSLSAWKTTFLSINSPESQVLRESGAGLGAVAATIDLVPAERPYDHGIGYVHAIWNVVPNAASFVKFNLPYNTPDIWLVNTLDPNYAATGGGFGFSFIAEAYLAFGWIGAPLVIAVIGWGLARLFLWGRDTGDVAKVAAVGAYLAFVLRYPGGTLEGFTRPLVLYSLLPFVLVGGIGAFRRRRTSVGNTRSASARREIVGSNV